MIALIQDDTITSCTRLQRTPHCKKQYNCRWQCSTTAFEIQEAVLQKHLSTHQQKKCLWVSVALSWHRWSCQISKVHPLDSATVPSNPSPPFTAVTGITPNTAHVTTTQAKSPVDAKKDVCRMRILRMAVRRLQGWLEISNFTAGWNLLSHY